MNKEQLLELRNKIVASAQEVAVNGSGDPGDRLQLLLNLIKGGDTSFDILNKAYELTGSINNDDGKLSALLDVLYEVDAKLGAIEGDAENAPANDAEYTDVQQQ